MRKVFVCMVMALLVVPFLATGQKADFTLSFEGKALIAGYREAGNFSWNIIKNCTVSFFFTKWIALKLTPFCWFSLRNGQLLICGSESNYIYTDGTRIKGFLIFPDGEWIIGGYNKG
jgi:hypothetical protein